MIIKQANATETCSTERNSCCYTQVRVPEACRLVMKSVYNAIKSAICPINLSKLGQELLRIYGMLIMLSASDVGSLI